MTDPKQLCTCGYTFEEHNHSLPFSHCIKFVPAVEETPPEDDYPCLFDCGLF